LLYVAAIVTFLLGLMGTIFKGVREDEKGQKIISRWGTYKLTGFGATIIFMLLVSSGASIFEQRSEKSHKAKETKDLQEALTRLTDQNEDLKSELRAAEKKNLDQATTILDKQTVNARHLLAQQKTVGAAMAHEIDRARHPLTRDISVRVRLLLPADVELTRKYADRVWNADWDDIFRRRKLQPSVEFAGEQDLAHALQMISVSLSVFPGKVTLQQLQNQEGNPVHIGMTLRPPPDSDEELLTLNRGCGAAAGPCWAFSLNQVGSSTGIFIRSDGVNLNLKPGDPNLVSLLDLQGTTVCACLSIYEDRLSWPGNVLEITFTDSTGRSVGLRRLSRLPEFPEPVFCRNGFIGYIPEVAR
jgi:hypothetical protein